MIAGRLAQIASAVHARLITGDVAFSGVSTDTRSTAPGELFIALRGEHHDAHDFLVQAHSRGAAAAIVEHEIALSMPQIVVADSQVALAELALWHREQLHARVIAITGSNGKTTVKTLTAAILAHAGHTAVTQGNLNNEIGLPLTLLRMPAETEFAVLEMGAGKPGDISYLARVARPHIALVNNVAPAHLERMGTLDGVAETKGAAYLALPDDGIAVINADDAFAGYFAKLAGARRVVRFGIANAADVRADALVLGETSRFTLHVPEGKAEIELRLPGRHNVMNALAASALALAAGATLAQIARGLNEAGGVTGRLTRHVLAAGITLLDDSYNANPGSTRAAIDTLALNEGTRWLVLGNMAELGPGAAALHAGIGEHAKASGIDALLTIGELSRHACVAFGDGARHFGSKAELAAALRDATPRPLTVLVKGSRSSAMDEIVRALIGERAGEAHHAA
jgi:UDP-N-acetylmuramoyl-tripeptide--D-alanyl-D-alanine ligase